CLVGAVVEAGRRHSPERGIAGSAIDALWRTLMETEERLVPDRLVPSPVVRGFQVRDLTRWNDHWSRAQEGVLRLVDVTIRRLLAETSAPELPSDSADDVGADSRRV